MHSEPSSKRFLPGWRVVLVIFLIIFAAYFGILYPWLSNWGATEAEQAMELPGDRLHPNADIQVTRAITIDAPPETVWAWVIQMGQDRAGFYSHDWIENLLGADIHNVDRIEPAWQKPQVGDLMPLARLDYLGGRVEASRPSITLIEPNRSLVVKGFASFELIPTEENSTRLIVRDWQGSADSPLIQRMAMRAYNFVFWDPGHFVMQRQMMHGIKTRAEGNPNPPAALSIASQLGWLAGAILVLGLFVYSGRIGWLIVPFAIVPPVLLTTGDVDAALAGFLAIGATLIGALIFRRRWWPTYLLIAASVLLVLLLTPYSHLIFGLAFGLITVGVLVAGLMNLLQESEMFRSRSGSHS
jgi:hypothetical protein